MLAADTPPADDPLPRRFGRYVLFDKIGEGGMARIYLGRTQTELGGERLAVVKQILPVLASSPELSALLIDEAKLAARLSHGNVAQVIDLGREGDTLYIAMEYVEGFDLSELLRRCSRSKVPLPIEFALLVVKETLEALDYAHRKRDDEGRPLGIVHRDVSPSNVLVGFEGQVKLCDFGIARALGSRDLPDEAIQGKAGYMSPEAAHGEPVDARSDVFAVGIIFWELLAGRRLYRSEKGAKPSLELARAAEIPPLPTRGLPQEAQLQAIVAKALAKRPEERWASASAMVRELDEYVGQSGLQASELAFGEWLTRHFGEEIVSLRRARERVAKAVEGGPPVFIEARPLPAPSTQVSTPEPVQPSRPGQKNLDDAPASQMAFVRVSRPEPEQNPRIRILLLIVAFAAILGLMWWLRHR